MLIDNHHPDYPISQTLGDQYKFRKSPASANSSRPEDRLQRFHKKMERVLATNPDPIDRNDIHDPLCGVEYVKEISELMLAKETQYLPSPGYMKIQTDINERMRGILIDWLIEVHLKFKLVPETLYLTVNLIDRYLEMEAVKRDKLQLIGVTAMLIACKYEEIYPPEIKDFVYITDNAYNKQEIMDMEYFMLKKFKFNITVISSYRILERLSKLGNDTQETFFLTQYLMELSLVEYRMLKYKPSIIAAGSLYLAHKINGGEDAWPLKASEYTKLSEKSIRPGAKEICILLQNSDSASLKAAKKKFSLVRFKEVAQCQIDDNN